MSDNINFETITMEDYKRMKDFDITYGIVPTKFGQCLIGTHEDKICYISLFDEGKDNSAIDILQQDWANARLKEDTKQVEQLANDIFDNHSIELVEEEPKTESTDDKSDETTDAKPDETIIEKAVRDKDISTTVSKRSRKMKKLNVLLRGTEMQCKVWMELTKLKEGMTMSYEQIAKAVGSPRAIRAVATAISKNKIAYVIPCHRVIRKSGALSKYRWGPERKKKILKCEGIAEQ